MLDVIPHSMCRAIVDAKKKVIQTELEINDYEILASVEGQEYDHQGSERGFGSWTSASRSS